MASALGFRPVLSGAKEISTQPGSLATVPPSLSVVLLDP